MVFRRHDLGGPARPRRSFLPSPPEKLGSPPRRLRPFLAALWFACLALAVVAQAGASWRVFERHRVAAPFASLGLSFYDARRRVSVASDRIPYSNVHAINWQEIPRDESPNDIARRLVGPDGEWVTLGLTGRDRSTRRRVDFVVNLQRNADNRARVSMREGWLATYSQWIDVAVALFLIAAATVFRVRCFKEPVPILVSFALLFLATLGTQDFWRWAGLYYADYVLDGIWITLLLAAIPALPSGRYVPAWTRWLVLAGPLGEAVMALGLVARLELVRGLLILMALLCVYLRFQHTPRGAERQKMKWASLGLGAGLLMCAVGQLMLMYHASLPFPGEIKQGFAVGGYALSRAALVIMALGMLVSLLGYRLNDADAAIAWSGGYAAVSTLLAVVWAASQAWSEKVIGTYTQDSHSGLAAGISTLVALAILAPARARAMAWTEARFQPALARLRSLPERIARWRQDDDREALAARALNAIAEGVDAVDAALIAYPAGRQPEIVGLHNISEEAVKARLRKARPRTRPPDDFPLRIEINNYAEAPMTLLIGRRGDRAFYSKQERAAVAAIAEPLADAIHAATRWTARYTSLDGALARIDERLQQMNRSGPRRRGKRPGEVSPDR